MGTQANPEGVAQITALGVSPGIPTPNAIVQALKGRFIIPRESRFANRAVRGGVVRIGRRRVISGAVPSGTVESPLSGLDGS